MSEINAVGKFLLVKQDILQERVQGSIIIPNTAAIKFATGVVHSINAASEDLKVTNGDRVLYGSGQGMEIEFAGEKLIVLNSVQIIAVVKD